ncbi:hypothetical protein EJB05_37971, partial [Eragrostis curvula]
MCFDPGRARGFFCTARLRCRSWESNPGRQELSSRSPLALATRASQRWWSNATLGKMGFAKGSP